MPQVPPDSWQRKAPLVALCVVSLSALLGGCGPELDESILNSGLSPEDPQPGNFPTWHKSWRKGSWIVAIRDPHWQDDHMSRLALYRKSVLGTLRTGAQALVAQAGATLRDPDGFTAAMDSMLRLDLVGHNTALPNLPTLSPSDQQTAFLLVQMNDIVTLPTLFFDRTGWTFTDLARQLGILSGSDPLRMLVQWQHDSLGTLDAALWVEPDLYSFWSSANTPQQAPAPYTPAEFEFRNSAVLSRLRLIKADLAYNFTGQGVSDRRPINVAVLDTGVDHKHPDLENQMWRNEGETPDNGNDDEGNGYKDDIHGIDATLGPGDDGGLQPRPGSADIGGPGVACPRPSIDNDDKLVDNCGHGTHVAGIIAAQHGADTQTLGICPNCRIMSVRVAERCVQPDTSKNKGDCVLPRSPLKDDQYEVDGNIADSAQIRALQYLFNTRNASNRGTLAVNIVNMSLGKYFRSRSMAYLLQKLQESNVAIVAAAGNDDTDTPSFPAAYEAVVAVCATSIQGSRGDYGKASFSNFGEWVDLCAPGEGIQSTMPGRSGNIGEVDTKQGTSQATPFVSGALGYLMSVSVVQQDVQQLIKVLKKAATSNLLYNDKANLIPGGTDSAYLACYKDRSSCDYLLGTGLLNLHKAVNPNAAGETFSEVDLNKKLAVSSGCVVSSVGHGRYAALNFWTSMPILLLQTLGAFAFCRRRFGRPSRMP